MLKARLHLLCLLLACLAPAASVAADRCSEGNGGGIGGMGGTGAAEPREAPSTPPTLPGPAGGMGGTGLIPPTEGSRAAFVGVITRFGSICVNGDRVQYDASVLTLFNGRAGNARDLHIGQLVRVEAVVGATELRATRIGVIDAVSGPVTRREEALRRFWVMGLPVQLDDDTAIGLSGPTVPEIGASVRVSGLMTLDGGLIASRLERADAADPVRVTGRLTELDGRMAEVAAVHVMLPVSAPSLPLAPGREVAVSGRWTGETLEADAIEVEPRFGFLERPDFVSLEGYLHTCTQGTGVGLDGIELRFPEGEAPAPSRGAVVVVGVPSADGSLAVARVTPAGLRDAVDFEPGDPDSPGRLQTVSRCLPRLAPATTTP